MVVYGGGVIAAGTGNGAAGVFGWAGCAGAGCIGQALAGTGVSLFMKVCPYLYLLYYASALLRINHSTATTVSENPSAMIVPAIATVHGMSTL
jgi:hypothetical protein